MLKYITIVAAIILTSSCTTTKKVQRFGSVIGVKDDKLAYYKKLHANPWPEVVTKLQECNLNNYSIYLKKMDDGKHYLFSYFEYTGNDIKSDFKKLSEDKTIQKWWKETDPCQFPLKGEKSWSTMEEVYHSK